MSSNKYPWDEIEQEYINGLEQFEIRKKYGMAESTLRRHIDEYGLREKRQKMTQNVYKKATERIEKQKVNKMTKLIKASDKMDDLILDFLRREGDESNGYDVIPPMRTKDLQSLSRALKDAVEVKQSLHGIIGRLEAERLAIERERLALERERLKAQQDKDNIEPTIFALSDEAERYAE